MRLTISTHQLGSHAQQLRNCLNTSGNSVTFRVIDGTGSKLVIMSGSSTTKEVRSDRGIREQAFMIHNRAGRHSIWLAFNEVWKISKQSLVFENAGFRIYIAPHSSIEYSSSDLVTSARQLMRVEWEGKNVQNGQGWIYPAPGAGHPHVQFDRCSMPSEINNLGQDQLASTPAREFQPENSSSGAIELDWFHKLHFPLHAPWHTSPYTQDLTHNGGVALSHTVQPNNLAELELWIKSVTRYLKEQFSNYA